MFDYAKNALRHVDYHLANSPVMILLGKQYTRGVRAKFCHNNDDSGAFRHRILVSRTYSMLWQI